jgi:regulator of protease activity HflC (stomatin/prohibitin superfamily)
MPSASPGVVVFVIILAALLLAPAWIWFGWRIEPDAGKIAVPIRKTGQTLPTGQIIAVQPGFKGIQLEVLPEGRYFRNPYTWSWRIEKSTEIPAGKLGVVTRLFGEDLSAGEIIARDGTKGILADVLSPGRHRMNPYAYRVQLFDAITIRPGHAGIVTSLIGDDGLEADLPSESRNAFLIAGTMKGVRREVLDAGTYYLNPFLFHVVEVNLQSHRFEMSGEDAISFLTLDGFTVNVEGTLEFAVIREEAPLVTHRIGDMEDILKKVILPRARGFSRIEGSKNPAIDYIVGETRQRFQDKLETHLRERCMPWGVSIRSVLIRNIQPPDEIARIIREREVAVQDAKKFEQQIEQAKSQAELTRQEMLALQNKAKVEAETLRIRAVISAEQDQEVRLTSARKELEVARLDREAARFRAEARLSLAGAEQQVIRLDNEAQAGVIAEQSAAFGGGLNLARYTFYEKLAPRIVSILSTDGPDGLGAVLQPLMPAAKEDNR